MADIKALCGNVNFIFKIVEAILCLLGTIAICIGDASQEGRGARLSTIIIDMEVYLLITLAFIVIYLVDETHKLLEQLFILVGGLMNCSTAVGRLLYLLADDALGGSSGGYPVALTVIILGCGIIMIIDFAFLSK